MPRIEARQYISTYQEDKYSHNETLLNFARLDFYLLQQLHQKELCELTRWWKDLDFVKKLHFTRNRLVECYFIALGIFFEPEYYFGRRTFCKVIYMLSAIDDIYDVHGTLEELELFNEAIQRWDISALDQSPDYMKVCFQAQLDVFTEIEEKLASEGNLYAIHHARESLKMTVAGYMKETRWFYSKYTPTFDEYMPLGTLTSSYYLSITAVVGMGLAATKDSLDWLFTDPGILNATSVIGRLLNDIRTHQREHAASVVELYMKEHGATEEEAIVEVELTNQVNDAWKVIIKGCLHPTPVPLPVLMRPLRVASTWEVLYKSADSYTSPGAEF